MIALVETFAVENWLVLLKINTERRQLDLAVSLSVFIPLLLQQSFFRQDIHGAAPA